MPTQIFFGDFPEGVLISDRVPQPENHTEAPKACAEEPSINPPSQEPPPTTNGDATASTFNAILAQQNPFVDNVLRLEFIIGMTTLQNYLLSTIKRMDLSEDPLQSFFNMANDFFASYHITLVCVRINQKNPRILELHFVSSADRWKADDLAMVFGDFCLHGNIRRWEDHRTLVIRNVPANASLVGEPDGRHDFREGFNGWVALKTEHVEELGKMNPLDDGREYRIREVLCYHNPRGPAVQSQMNMWVITFSDADCAARFLGKGKFNFFGYMDGFVSYWVPKRERHGGDRRKVAFKPPQWINGEWVKVHQVGAKIEETGLKKVEEKGKEKAGQIEVPSPNDISVRCSSRDLGQHQIQENAKTVRAKEKTNQVGTRIKKAEDVKEKVKGGQIGASIKKAEDAQVKVKEIGQGGVGTKITRSSKGKVGEGASQNKAKTETERGDPGSCKQRKKFKWQVIKAKRREEKKAEEKKAEEKVEEKIEEKVARVEANSGESATSVMGEMQRKTGGKVEGEAEVRAEEKTKDKVGETEVGVGKNLGDAGEEVGEEVRRMKEKVNQARNEVTNGSGNVEERPREKEGKEIKGKVGEVAVRVEEAMGNTEEGMKEEEGKEKEEAEENSAGKGEA